MIIKTIALNLTEDTAAYLNKLCELTGISIDGIVTGILWDMILKEEDKKKSAKKINKKGKRK